MLFRSGTGDKQLRLRFTNQYGRTQTYDTKFEGVVTNLQRAYKSECRELIDSIERYEPSAEDQAAAQHWLEQSVQAGQALAALRLAELILDGPEAEASRGKAVELLKVARKDPETDGFAAARLRSLGSPITD